MRKINLKIQTQIITLVSFLLLFQVILAGISYIALKDINSNLNNVFSKTLPAIDNLIQGDRDFQQALVAERTLLLPGISEKVKAAQIADYIKNTKQVIERFELYAKSSTSALEKKVHPIFVEKYNLWKEKSNKLLSITKTGFQIDNETRAQKINHSLGDIGGLFEDSRTQMDKLQEIILSDAKFKFENSQQEYKEVILFIFGLLSTCLLVSFIISFLFIKGIVSKIKNSVKIVEDGSEELAHISNTLSEKAVSLSSSSQELSSSVTETSSSLHEISSMVKKNTDMAVNSASIVNRGKEQLSRGVSLIHELAKQVDGSNQSSKELVGKVDHNYNEFESILKVFSNIQEKTSVINDIVFQTKLLSFNASVEAARAGEHGKGFSVVAEEIGNLAQMSGESSTEISELLDGSLKTITNIISNSKTEISTSVDKNEKIIKHALKLSNDCESVLKDIDSMFQDVTQSTNAIATASKEQSVGVDEINGAVQEIDMANKTTAKNANELEFESNKIVDISQGLNVSIDDIRKLVR